MRLLKAIINNRLLCFQSIDTILQIKVIHLVAEQVNYQNMNGASSWQRDNPEV